MLQIVSQTPWQGVKHQWNAANTLTAIRPLCAIPVVIFVFCELHWFSVAFVALAGVTDYLDGFLARSTNTTTALGRAFDPLADKVFTDLVLLAIVFITMDPVLLALWALTFSYDIDNTLRRVMEIKAACVGKRNAASALPVTSLSKWKTAMLFILMGVFLLPPDTVAALPVEITTVLTWGTVILVFCSWLHNRELVRW